MLYRPTLKEMIKQAMYYCAILGLFVIAVGGFINDRNEYANTFGYQAELKTGKIADARKCRLTDDKKLCEILEDRNNRKVAEYVVEDFWEK